MFDCDDISTALSFLSLPTFDIVQDDGTYLGLARVAARVFLKDNINPQIPRRTHAYSCLESLTPGTQTHPTVVRSA